MDSYRKKVRSQHGGQATVMFAQNLGTPLPASGRSVRRIKVLASSFTLPPSRQSVPQNRFPRSGLPQFCYTDRASGPLSCRFQDSLALWQKPHKAAQSSVLLCPVFPVPELSPLIGVKGRRTQGTSETQ